MTAQLRVDGVLPHNAADKFRDSRALVTPSEPLPVSRIGAATMVESESTPAPTPTQFGLADPKPDFMGQIGRALFFPERGLANLKPAGERRHYRELFVMALAQMQALRADYQALALRHASTAAAWRAEREAHASTKTALARAMAARS